MIELERHRIWRNARHRAGAVSRRRLTDHSDGGAPQAGVIVVGVDDSPAGHAAVELAAMEAELRRWDLWLLHVQPAGAAWYSAGDGGARLLERMTDQVHCCAPTVTVSSHLAVGAAATVLLAELSDTDMVVVGQHSGRSRTAFGLRTEERVAALHRGPALVVPVTGRPAGPESADRPVVVGVDDSSSSTSALDFARAEASLRGCELIALPAPADGDEAEALVDASERAAAVVIDRRGAELGHAGRALVRDAACPVFLIG